jgi:hypothetical protein
VVALFSSPLEEQLSVGVVARAVQHAAMRLGDDGAFVDENGPSIRAPDTASRGPVVVFSMSWAPHAANVARCR